MLTPAVVLWALCAASNPPSSGQPGMVKRVPTTPSSFSVVQVTPAPISVASATTTVSVEFNRPVLNASVNTTTFRVAGRWSGTASGTYITSNNGRTVTFTPDAPFSAGETVSINLSHDIVSVDRIRLRSAGYAYQFWTAVTPSTGSFVEIDELSNHSTGEQTYIYGAAAADLNNDGYLDLTTINEVSADLRVFLNLADGTGNYSGYLLPTPVGPRASPNEAADFNNDGNADLCVAAADSNSVWVLYGNGDGSFGTVAEIPVGLDPHGIAVLDVDGDADMDIVNCNRLSDNLSLIINNGWNGFSAPYYFDSGAGAEYGLVAGDINADGITDLVVGGLDGWHVAGLLGNGDGTFTPAGLPEPCGGPPWVVALADVNGDQKLDISAANSYVGNGSVMLGTGIGTFGSPALMPVGFHVVATEFADLDGDGDQDWILSSFGGGFWRLYRNNGSGVFSAWQQLNAPGYPSCAVPLDFDNDGDLDLALSDEVEDVVVLMKNL